jgi:hypothetical protein
MGLAGVGLVYVKQAGAVTDRAIPNLPLANADSSQRADGPRAMRPSGRPFDGRDPFLPTVIRHPESQPSIRTPQLAPSKPSWVVSSILFQDSAKSAIVNDAWVSVGDRIVGGQITAIDRKFVVITDASGARHVVALKERSQ